LRIVAVQGVLATTAPRGLDRHDNLHLCDRHQPPCLPFVAGLPPRPTTAGLVARPLVAGLGRITRRRARGRPRVLLQLLLQLLESRLQRRDAGLQRLKVCLRLRR
jgi:hypothetical protein